MMKYPELYLDWIDYLHEKKIYGAWIKDLSQCALMTKNGVRTYIKQSTLCISGKCAYIDRIINSFDTTDKGLKDVIHGIEVDLFWVFFNSKAVWSKVYRDFYALRHPPITLSRKLSKKLYRANNKVSSCYHPLTKQEQPWYDKSYEKNKYNKKAWRK